MGDVEKSPAMLLDELASLYPQARRKLATILRLMSETFAEVPDGKTAAHTAPTINVVAGTASAHCWVRYRPDLWMRLFQAMSVSVDSLGSAGVKSMGRSSSLPLWNTAPAPTMVTGCGG